MYVPAIEKLICSAVAEPSRDFYLAPLLLEVIKVRPGLPGSEGSSNMKNSTLIDSYEDACTCPFFFFFFFSPSGALMQGLRASAA